jgi:hypothetical protein
MCDLHGSKDITLECEGNVVMDRNKSVAGSTMNNILLSLFTLNSHSNRHKPLLGSITSWRAVEESLCVMLLTIAKVDHLMQRIFHLILRSCFDTELPGMESKIYNLAEGALSFLSVWTKQYWRFISPQDFSYMKQSLEDFLFHLLQYESEPGGSLVHTFAQRIRGCITSCSIGANQDIIAPVVKTAALGIWDKTSEKPSFLDGSLESIQQRKAMKMRKPTDVTPPVIAIFGITQEMLDQSDDDEEDIPIELLSCDSFSPIADTSPTPISRISAGYDMLQPHSGVEIWDFDVKELARQWTLMDHSLFLAIPLTYLQYCQWANPRHVSEANEVRSFIDRFNAESCWVTQSLLNQDTPEKRAALYMKFTFLASFLEELNNFNGLMAILTALQQVGVLALTTVSLKCACCQNLCCVNCELSFSKFIFLC